MRPTRSQLPLLPAAQVAHSPHATWKGTLTRSPGWTPATASPVSTTSATPSCPAGSDPPTGIRPRVIQRSRSQVATATGRTSASPSPCRRGSSASRHSTPPPSTYVSCRIRGVVRGSGPGLRRLFRRRRRLRLLALGIGGLAELLEADHLLARAPVAVGYLSDDHPDAQGSIGAPSGGAEDLVGYVLHQPGLTAIAERAAGHRHVDHRVGVGLAVGGAHGRPRKLAQVSPGDRAEELCVGRALPSQQSRRQPAGQLLAGGWAESVVGDGHFEPGHLDLLPGLASSPGAWASTLVRIRTATLLDSDSERSVDMITHDARIGARRTGLLGRQAGKPAGGPLGAGDPATGVLASSPLRRLSEPAWDLPLAPFRPPRPTG